MGLYAVLLVSSLCFFVQAAVECGVEWNYKEYTLATTAEADAVARTKSSTCSAERACVRIQWTAPTSPNTGYRVGTYQDCDPPASSSLFRHSICEELFGDNSGCTYLSSPHQPGSICCCAPGKSCDLVDAMSKMNSAPGLAALGISLIFSLLVHIF